MKASKPTKNVTIRLSEKDFSLLKREAVKLNVAPTKLAQNLVLNGLHGRKDETVITVVEDVEQRQKEEIQSLQKKVDNLSQNLVNSTYSLATATHIFLASFPDAQTDRAEELIKRLFPNWAGLPK